MVPVVLVCMPWSLPTRPSVALGILKSVLAREGFECAVMSNHLAFAEHLSLSTAHDDERIGLVQYEEIANELTGVGAGDWVFAVPPYREADEVRDEKYFDLLSSNVSKAKISRLVRARKHVPSFLEVCAQEILAHQPKIVGFTTTFCQNVPSLVLAKILKERNPSLTIVFGGSNCEGPMGAALHRAYRWVDAVVRGEGEKVFPQFVREVLSGADISLQPGLCVRKNGKTIAIPEGDSQLVMGDVPSPDYDEYFERAAQSALTSSLKTTVRIPYESSRGCWWGAKHHCTFCGLNGSTMRFRSKPGTQVLQELRALAARHKCLDVYVVDNILDMKYFETVLPALTENGWDFRFFVETKSNLRLDQVIALRDSGVVSIQPGIESLSTPILHLMRKGVSALQNIRLLKWCAAFGIDVHWNIIYGFPGETEEEYSRMAALISRLTHLAPPGAARLRIDRFSPYFETPAALGIGEPRPQPFYQHIYDVDASTLADIAYFFDADRMSGNDPDVYAKPLLKEMELWKAEHESNTPPSLRYRIGPDFILIDDQRRGYGPAQFLLDGPEAAIYLACEEGTSAERICADLASEGEMGLTVKDVTTYLHELEEAGLIYHEAGHYLALAVPENPSTLRARAKETRHPRLEGRVVIPLNAVHAQ